MGIKWPGMLQADIGEDMKAQVREIADNNAAFKGNISAATRDLLERGIKDLEKETALLDAIRSRKGA